MAAGSAALAHGGEVAGAGAGAGYGGSEVAGVGQNYRGGLSEHTGGVLATRPRSERGEHREGRGNSGEEFRPRGEAIDRDRTRLVPTEGGVLWTYSGTWNRAGLVGHRAGHGRTAS
jgi:hypothetical protein